MPSFYLRRKENFRREKERQAIHPSVFLNAPLPPFHLEGHSPQKEQQNTMLQIFSKWAKKKLHGHLGAQLNAPKGSPKGESPSRIGVPSSSPGCLTSRQSWMICERKRMRKRRRVLIQYCIRGERYLFSRPLPSHPLSTASVFNIAPNKRNLKEDGRATTIAANIHHASHASR